MKYLMVVILLLVLQNTISAENIYEDAISHLIKDEIDHQELSFSEGNRDSLYHFSLFFEPNEIFVGNEISSTISGYKIAKMKMDDFKTYVDTCSKRRGVIFSIERMNFCKTCDAPFLMTIVACHMDKYKNIRVMLHEIRYDYDCQSKALVYKYCASGVPSQSWINSYLQRKKIVN